MCVHMYTYICKYGYIYIMYIHMCIYVYVMGVTKMGNIVPRAGFELTSLAFWTSVLPLHHTGSLISPIYPRLPIYAAPCLRDQCRLLHSFPFNCKSFNAYNYIYSGNDLLCTYMDGVGSTTIQLITCIGSWSWQPVSWVWWKWEILCLEWESNPHVAFWSSVLSLHHIGSLISRLYPPHLSM